MDKQSLIKAKELIIKLLNEQKEINKIDTSELMINLNRFLDDNEYQENVKTLQKTQKRKRY